MSTRKEISFPEKFVLRKVVSFWGHFFAQHTVLKGFFGKKSCLTFGPFWEFVSRCQVGGMERVPLPPLLYAHTGGRKAVA